MILNYKILFTYFIMIEKILYKNKLFALIVRRKFRKKAGINFFTSNEDTQQFGYMKHKKKLHYTTTSAQQKIN